MGAEMASAQERRKAEAEAAEAREQASRSVLRESIVTPGAPGARRGTTPSALSGKRRIMGL